jgi:membrane associated rhomboid family serine protease
VKRRFDFPVTLAISVCAIAATAAALAYPRVYDGLAVHGPWRVVTGPFVHATWGHLVRDLVLVVLAGVAYEGPLARYRLALFGGGLLVPALAVLLTHEADWYCGLSGLSHALLAAAFAYEAVNRRGRARAIVRVVGVVAALKPLYEMLAGGPVFPMSLGPGVGEHVPLAHVMGVVVGIPCGLKAAFMRQAAAPAAPR